MSHRFNERQLFGCGGYVIALQFEGKQTVMNCPGDRWYILCDIVLRSLKPDTRPFEGAAEVRQSASVFQRARIRGGSESIENWGIHNYLDGSSLPNFNLPKPRRKFKYA
jgi:hypothetical protein